MNVKSYLNARVNIYLNLPKPRSWVKYIIPKKVALDEFGLCIYRWLFWDFNR